MCFLTTLKNTERKTTNSCCCVGFSMENTTLRIYIVLHSVLVYRLYPMSIIFNSYTYYTVKTKTYGLALYEHTAQNAHNYTHIHSKRHFRSNSIVSWVLDLSVTSCCVFLFSVVLLLLERLRRIQFFRFISVGFFSVWILIQLKPF